MTRDTDQIIVIELAKPNNENFVPVYINLNNALCLFFTFVSLVFGKLVDKILQEYRKDNLHSFAFDFESKPVHTKSHQSFYSDFQVPICVIFVSWIESFSIEDFTSQTAKSLSHQTDIKDEKAIICY